MQYILSQAEMDNLVERKALDEMARREGEKTDQLLKLSWAINRQPPEIAEEIFRVARLFQGVKPQDEARSCVFDAVDQTFSSV